MNDPPSSADGRGALVGGKYEVLRFIGRGGMGSVWEGRHATLGTRVAIKFVDAEHADNDEARSRFLTEARAAAAIQSKHAIQIFDHGVADDGRPYIVMELLVGEPLDARIERCGRLDLAETARILAQVCRALARAHGSGIIHRDLKPENIFLVRSMDDEDEIAKVLDFGIAKIRVPFQDSEPTSSTETGAVLGTPYYMSPEQARGFRTIDHRTDLWSLGVIAYKCVTGVLPFEGQSVGDLLVKICTGPLPIPSRTVPGLPAAFDAWFARALDREPYARFASASELAEALATIAGVSVRRGASTAEGMSLVPSPDQARTDALPPSSLLAAVPGANSTSAPFTAPASPAKASRGVIAGVAFASILAGSAGVAAVARFISDGRAAPATLAPAAQASVHLLPSTPSNAPDAAPTPAIPASVHSTVAPAPASPAPPTTVPASASSLRPPAPDRAASPVVHGADKPQSAVKIAAPPAVPPAAHPAARPTSSADPGY